MVKGQGDFSGISCDKAYIDTETDAGGSRTEFYRMMSAINYGDMVIVEGLSELASNMRDILQAVEAIIAKGAGLVAIKEGFDSVSECGKAALRILESLAEIDRKSIEKWQEEAIMAARRRK